MNNTDILQCIVQHIPLLLRLPLRTLGRRMELAVNRSIRSIRFLKEAPVEVLSQKFVNLQHVTVYTEKHVQWICAHNRNTIQDIKLNTEPLLYTATGVSLGSLPHLIRLEVEMHKWVAKSFRSSSLVHLIGDVHLEDSKQILEFPSKFPSLTRLDVTFPKIFYSNFPWETYVQKTAHLQSIGVKYCHYDSEKTLLPDSTVAIGFAEHSNEMIQQCLRRMTRLQELRLWNGIDNLHILLGHVKQLKILQLGITKDVEAVQQLLLDNATSLESFSIVTSEMVLQNIIPRLPPSLKHLRVGWRGFRVFSDSCIDLLVQYCVYLERLHMHVDSTVQQKQLLDGLPRLRIFYPQIQVPLAIKEYGRARGVSVLSLFEDV